MTDVDGEIVGLPRLMLGLSERLTLGRREDGYDDLILGPRVDGIRVGESMLGILVVGLEGITLESKELEGSGFNRIVLCMLGKCVELFDGSRDS